MWVYFAWELRQVSKKDVKPAYLNVLIQTMCKGLEGKRYDPVFSRKNLWRGKLLADKIVSLIITKKWAFIK